MNLLSNAGKFTENGRVELTVQREGTGADEKVFFHVRDNGIGIPMDKQAQLFEDFVQADASTTRKYGGTGLGLAISRRLCRLMGGDIAVSSQPGVGSTFTAILPVRTASSKEFSSTRIPAVNMPVIVPSEKLPAANDAPLQHCESCVLIIDDDPETQQILKTFLEKEGWTTYFASTGSDGLQMAAQLQPDAITLDVMMPEMDGWTVLTALKSNAETADIPVIMLTMLDDHEMGYALGASEYLVKPVERKRVIEAIRTHSDRKGPGSVLVVEDDPDVRDLLRHYIAGQGMTVEMAENGRVALRVIDAVQPDVILLDLMMPEMDGFEFVTELRRIPRWQQTPVIVLTAKDLTDEDRKRLNGDVMRVFQKGAASRRELLQELRTRLNEVASRGSERT